MKHASMSKGVQEPSGTLSHQANFSGSSTLVRSQDDADTISDIRRHRIKAAECSGGTSSERIYQAIEQIIAAMELRGSVLDYGAGTGQLTRRLISSKRFKHIAAADILAAPSSLPPIVNWLEQDLNLALAAPGQTFDVIIAAEVIEHLENPRLMMRECFRLLRPGGTVLISTPNNESWRSLVALLIRGHFVAFSDSCYPAHITPVLRRDCSRIFREVGFNDPTFHFTDFGGLPGCPSITWQRVSLGMLAGVRFSDNVVVVANKPRIPDAEE